MVLTVASEPALDTQHAIMSAAMLNAKRARMRVEADRQILANRIARLQSEEMKAVRRIEETHRRTQEILAVKMRQQQVDYERHVVKSSHDGELEQHREKLLQIKEERKYSILAAKQATVVQRQHEVRASKTAAAENSLLIARSRGSEYNEAAFKRNAVRQSEASARDRKRREKELMVEFLQKRSDDTKRDELDEAQRMDDRMRELLLQEQQLLESLHGHKEQQQRVIVEIEETLSAQRGSAVSIAAMCRSGASASSISVNQ